jgi:small nuclear ribonucleoprotein B and B'
MLQLLNYRLKLTLQDGRVFIGQMIAFDRYMNLVLADCEEFRTVKKKGMDLRLFHVFGYVDYEGICGL